MRDRHVGGIHWYDSWVGSSATWGNKGKEGLSRIINQDIRRQYDARASGRYQAKRHGSVASIPGMFEIRPDPAQAQFYDKDKLGLVFRDEYGRSLLFFDICYIPYLCGGFLAPMQSSSRGLFVSNGEVIIIDLKGSPMRVSQLTFLLAVTSCRRSGNGETEQYHADCPYP